MVVFKSKQRGKMFISIDADTYEILHELKTKHSLSFAEVVKVLAVQGKDDFENMLKKIMFEIDHERV